MAKRSVLVRHGPAGTREEPAEGGWIIAAVETVINPVRHPRSYKVLCSGCGKEVVIPLPAEWPRTAVHGMLQQSRIIQGGNMNKKIYVPTSIPGHRTWTKSPILQSGNVMSVKIVRTGKRPAERHCVCGDVHTMEGRRAASMFNRQDFMEELAGKRSYWKTQFPGR